MDHIDILKQSFRITWRYRALWLFGFLLALCGGGGSTQTNFNFPGGGGGSDGGFDSIPNTPNVDPNLIIALIIGLFCLFIFLTIISTVVQVVTRTALIRMVEQITKTETVTIGEGWRLGWSIGAWRIFLLGLVINIPLFIISMTLILLALTPLFLLITEEPVLMGIGIMITIFIFIIVIFILMLIGAIVTLFLDLARRHVVLSDQGVFAGLSGTFSFIKKHIKDVFIVWLLMIGVGLAWGFIALFTLFPITLLILAIFGGIPFALVYFISGSFWGGLIAGVPFALIVAILVGSFVSGLYLIFRSTVWTLAYLEIQGLDTASASDEPAPEPSDSEVDDSDSATDTPSSVIPEPQPAG